MAALFREPSFVNVDSRKLAYNEVCPSAPGGTILLLIGLAAKRYGWFHQLDEFGSYYRTIALEHRDISDSDEVMEAYTVAHMADDAAAAMRALGVQHTHVVGISMGGFVALQFALRHPEHVDKLVLVSTSAGGPTHVPPAPEIMTLLAGRAGQNIEVGELARRIYTGITAPGFAQSHPEELDRVAEIARYRPVHAAAYYRQLQACMTHNVSQQLDRIQAPTLVIHGDVDPLVVPANGDYLAKHIKGAKHIVFHNVGHVPILECHEQFNRDVLAFLDS
jgi:pimeloyl-ACP methyl ester carboxylesterase